MNTEEFKKKTKLTPTQILVLGILFIILVGAILLKLPICNNKPISFIDSLFVSTSSVCVTGLTTIVIADQFSILGQIVIMCLIQIGGLRFNGFFSLTINYNGKKDYFIRKIIIEGVLKLK